MPKTYVQYVYVKIYIYCVCKAWIMCNARCMGREMLFPRREHHFAELIIIQEDDTFGPRESPGEALQSLDDHSCNQIRGNCDCDTNNITDIRYVN